MIVYCGYVVNWKFSRISLWKFSWRFSLNEFCGYFSSHWQFFVLSADCHHYPIVWKKRAHSFSKLRGFNGCCCLNLSVKNLSFPLNFHRILFCMLIFSHFQTEGKWWFSRVSKHSRNLLNFMLLLCRFAFTSEFARYKCITNEVWTAFS